MECVVSGNEIKCLNRAIICLSRIGSELLLEALPDKLTFRTLNSSRSAFLAVTFKAQFFDAYRLSVPVAQCSVLLKAVCTVFRTPPGSMEQLRIGLFDVGASKLQWTLKCINGLQKTYWITCNHEPEVQNVALDRKSFSSHLVVKPRDLNRLLANFQPTLQEITLIATEPSSTLDLGMAPEGKAVELRSYIDPGKENTDSSLHTQLWIDPTEELQEYSHSGIAVDVTFSLKESKAFMAFCEGSEAEIHIFFEKAGNPILLAPKFGLDDTAHADFDATLVLATMLGSQLSQGESIDQVPQAAAGSRPLSQTNEARSQVPQAASGSRPASQRHEARLQGGIAPEGPSQRMHENGVSTPGSGVHSDHTRIWSDLSGSATKSLNGKAVGKGSSNMEESADASEEILLAVQRQQSVHAQFTGVTASGRTPLQSARAPDSSYIKRDTLNFAPPQFARHESAVGLVLANSKDDGSRRNLSNWISGETEEDEDEDGMDDLFVQSTPPGRRGLGRQ